MTGHLTTIGCGLRVLRLRATGGALQILPSSYEAESRLPAPAISRRRGTQEEPFRTLLAALRASLVHDVVPSHEVIRQAVTLTLAGNHHRADAEELETLLLILRAHMAALIEHTETLGPRSDLKRGLLAYARALLGQSLTTDSSSQYRQILITRLSGMIDRLGAYPHSAITRRFQELPLVGMEGSPGPASSVVTARLSLVLWNAVGGRASRESGCWLLRCLARLKVAALVPCEAPERSCSRLLAP